MDFIRARTAEQKNYRIREIKNAAIALYGEMPFSKITLSMITDGLPFDRANVYRYFRSKEEIYLRVMMDDYADYFSALRDALTDVKSENDFCLIWAHTTYQYPRMIGLYSIWVSDLEPNVPFEMAVEAFRDFRAHGADLIQLMGKIFPELNTRLIRYFIWCQMRFVAGMSIRLAGNRTHDEALRAAGSEPLQTDYEQALAEYLHVLLSGMRAHFLSGQNCK